MAAWRDEDVTWGETECQRKMCSNMAELLFDGQPLCIDDADDLLDRIVAVELYPDMREMLPDWHRG